jgi:hypothetical protein
LVQFLLAFVLGGLFFSTVLAGVTAVAAVGTQNVKRLWSILKLVVTRVWKVFCLGVSETRNALRFDGKWNFKAFWKEVKRTLLKTRRAAAEGVEAIRMEARLYSAAVGAPGLIPIQYVIDRLMPFSIQTQMKESLKEALADAADNPNIKKATLVEFDSGKKAPLLLGARIYDLGSKAMVFDIDVNWQSELEAKINIYTRRLGFKVPITIQNVCFEGPVRVELSPLTSELPGFGAALVSLPSIPKISSDIRVIGGDISKVSWLENEIKKGIEEAIRETFLWPKRIVIPQEVALKTKTLLTGKEIEALESSDPFLTAEEKSTEEKPVLRDYLNLMAGDLASIPNKLQIDVSDKALVFDAIDADSDGVLSREEFMGAQDRIDRNRDGIITKKDLYVATNTTADKEERHLQTAATSRWRWNFWNNRGKKRKREEEPSGQK